MSFCLLFYSSINKERDFVQVFILKLNLSQFFHNQKFYVELEAVILQCCYLHFISLTGNKNILYCILAQFLLTKLTLSLNTMALSQLQGLSAATLH